MLSGATALTDAVRITLGPKSKCVLIQKKWGTPIVCNDGITTAKEIELANPEENLGAQMIREAAERTGDAVGDGTTYPPNCASRTRKAMRTGEKGEGLISKRSVYLTHQVTQGVYGRTPPKVGPPGEIGAKFSLYLAGQSAWDSRTSELGQGGLSSRWIHLRAFLDCVLRRKQTTSLRISVDHEIIEFMRSSVRSRPASTMNAESPENGPAESESSAIR